MSDGNVRVKAGYAFVASGAFLWGLWAVFVRLSGLEGPAAAVFAMAGMSLPALFLLRRGPVDSGSRRALLLLGLTDAGNAALYFAALVRGPISVAVLTHYLAPVLVALFAPYFAGEKRSRRAWLSSAVSLVGLVLLLGAFPRAGTLPVTAALGAASALFYAGNVFTSKRACVGYTAQQVAALHSPLTTLCLLLVFGSRAFPHQSGLGVLWVMAGGVLCGFLGTSLFNVGLKRVSAQNAGALTYLEPLTATLVAWLFFGERLSVLSWVGAAVILAAGLYVVTEPKTVRLEAPLLS